VVCVIVQATFCRRFYQLLRFSPTSASTYWPERIPKADNMPGQPEL